MSDSVPGRRRPGLGRGLSALLEEINASEGSGERENSAPASGGFRGQLVAISRIKPNPDQPRKIFDPEAQAELIDSVKRQGLLQPILVRPRDGGSFEIVAGERRWRAAQAAQLHEVPVVIRDLQDSEAYEIAIVENIQRQDLSPIEEARGYRHLMGEYGHTQNDVASLVGKSRSHIANLVRLLDLPQSVRAMVDDGRLAMGQARTLIGTIDPGALAQQIVEGGLSTRDAERLSKATGGKAASPKARKRAERDADLLALETRIREATGLPARLTFDGEGGQLVLRYGDLDQLDRLVERLAPQG
ncbi:MAG: ParB/RepB/Spo0J family partition protein [Pacificimonas sp.]